MRRQARKSFLINPDNLERDSALRGFLIEDRKHQMIEDRLQNESLFSWWRVRYLAAKNPNFVAHILLEINSIFLVQPFWTIKTRIQARNTAADHAFYFRNRADTRSLMLGTSHSLGLIFAHLATVVNIQRILGASERFANQTVERVNYFSYLLTDLITAPIRNCIEIRRALVQMGHSRITLGDTFYKMRQSMGVMFARDVALRTAVFGTIVARDPHRPDAVKAIDLLVSLLAGTLLSHPLDVICTKMYTQQLEAYPTFRQAIQTIIAEEKYDKFLSGFAMRFAAISMSTAVHFYFFSSVQTKVEASMGIDALID
jgi:hypothetical protein